MAEGDPAAQTRAEFLADWTQLSDDELKASYVSSYARGRALGWSALVGLAPPSLRLRAFEEAETFSFMR